MKRKLRIGIIFGGRSGEHEVSLASASSVVRALDPDKYDVVPIGITSEGRWVSSPDALGNLIDRKLDRETERVLLPVPQHQGLVDADGNLRDTLRLDVIFPLVHGTFGEDGTLQGLLELADIPYVGAGVLASAVGLDKVVQKQLFGHAGLPVSRYGWCTASEWKRKPAAVVRRMEKALRYPVFVKPANTGSSVGISKVHTRKELRDAIAIAAAYDRKIIVEQGIRNAREVECSILGNDEPLASVLGEITPSNEFYDYNAKYVDGKTTTTIPANLPGDVTKRVKRLAVQAFLALDCSGMARVDFFVTRKSHRIVVNELNTLPGFTSISMYPKLWAKSGLAYPELLDRLIELAFERHREKNVLKRSFLPARQWYR
jgi:D-alanine-D-alanine ligase